jgi:hypothetical protein
MKRIGERIRAFAEEVILPSGYRGKFNVDLLMDARGEVMELRENPGEDQNLFMELNDVWCEINARTSHSMNCDDVGISAAEKHPDVTFVCGGNVFPGTHMGGFQDMQALLQKNGLLYSKDSLGCIPYHTALLEAGFGQGGLFVPAQTFDQAVRIFLHAEEVLNKG